MHQTHVVNSTWSKHSRSTPALFVQHCPTYAQWLPSVHLDDPISRWSHATHSKTVQTIYTNNWLLVTMKIHDKNVKLYDVCSSTSSVLYVPAIYNKC